jgi:formate hydrogenlyase subunit 6/NADH:ubiquinone oxidoreductase subunit I
MTDVTEQEVPLKPPAPDYKKTTFGTGLLKGLAITMRHLLSRSVTVQYPDVKPELPARTRGVIALKEETCTVCMLCARECPDWCIYIDGHKEERAPAQEGKRAKKVNVLDRFAIDYALCMYCGICVEVCPYDALFWSPEFEYAEHDVTGLTHELEKLTDWMYTVPPPDQLEEGAQGPEFRSVAQKVAASAAAPPAAPAEAPAEVAQPETESDSSPPPDAEAPEPEAPEPEAPEAAQAEAASAPASDAPVAPGMSDEEAEEVGRKVYEEEIGKGVDPRVAEGRRKAAVIRAKKGSSGPGSSGSQG